jgi:hypothetical protein
LDTVLKKGKRATLLLLVFGVVSIRTGSSSSTSGATIASFLMIMMRVVLRGVVGNILRRNQELYKVTPWRWGSQRRL